MQSVLNPPQPSRNVKQIQLTAPNRKCNFIHCRRKKPEASRECPRSMVFVAVLVALYYFAPFLHAQQNGTVTGLVLDLAGNPIPNAVVTLVNHSVGFSQEQTTTADGRYTFLK